MADVSLTPMPAMRVCPCIGCPAHERSCPELTSGGRCPGCGREADIKRGRRQARGYDRTYDRARKQWKPKVDRGEVNCHAPTCLMPKRQLIPGQPFDLGHDDQRNIRGPEHPLCNRSAGGKAAHHHTQ